MGWNFKCQKKKVQIDFLFLEQEFEAGKLSCAADCCRMVPVGLGLQGFHQSYLTHLFRVAHPPPLQLFLANS